MEWYKLFGFPVKWFFEKYDKYKVEGNFAKIISLFLVSLSGVLLFGGVFAWTVMYLITHKPEWCVIAGLIFWFYAYIRSKMKPNTNIPAPVQTIVDAYQQQLQSQAEKDYPRMRTVMYQTLKEIAAQIGCKVPRILAEIEIMGSQFIISKGIIFYQFKLEKADMHARYTLADLNEFKETVQSMIVSLSNSGRFPTLQLQSYQTIYGNWLCGVTVDVIEDLDSHLIIQTVFASPAYAEYQHDIQMNKQNNDNVTLPDAVWDEYDC